MERILSILYKISIAVVLTVPFMIMAAVDSFLALWQRTIEDISKND